MIITPTLIVFLGLAGLGSLAVLVVLSAMEDPRIIAAGIGGWMITFLFERAGTTVMTVLGSISALVVLVLMIPVFVKHIREVRFWAPLTVFLLTIAIIAAISIRISLAT